MIVYKKMYKKYTVVGLLLLLSGIGALGMMWYRKKMRHSAVYYHRIIMKKKKKNTLTVINDHFWCKKQEKYLPYGGKLYSVSFPVKRQSDESVPSLKRKGWLFYRRDAKATVVVCHGFMTSKEDMGLIRLLLSQYNVFTFDFRAHGEESKNQLCTLGNDEKNDVIGAALYIKQMPELQRLPLIVYGFSMGAVASILAQKEHPNLFSGAILDCPYDSTDNLVNRTIERMKVSFFGYNFCLPGTMLLKKYIYHPYLQQLFKLFLHFFRFDVSTIATSFQKISPKDAIQAITVPLFLIACHNDDKAPPHAVKEIYYNAKSAPYKRMWISIGRKHFDALLINPEKYRYKLINFIEMIIDGSWREKKREKIKEDPYLYFWEK